MRAPLVLLLAAALALASSGCIANAKDLKDKLTPAATSGDSGAPATTPSPATHANATPPKPPVARLSVFGAGGAMLFQSAFTADDVTTPVLVEDGTPLTFVGTDSEALAPGAKLVSYAWDLAGNASSGAKANATFHGAGKYPIKLTVIDSNGQSDSQLVVLGIAPKPYDVTTNLSSGPILGAGGMGQDGAVSFELAYPRGGAPATVQGVKILVPAQQTCDVVLTVLDSNKKTVGSSDKGGLDAPEQVDLPALPEGKYTIDVSAGDACVEKDGVTIQVTITYLPLLI